MKVQCMIRIAAECCQPETNLAEAAAMMWESDSGALPVVDNAGEVIGLITDGDICLAVVAKHRLASAIAVSEVISGKLYAQG